MTQQTLFRRTVYIRQLEVVSKKVKIAETEAPYFSKMMRSPEDVYRCFSAIFEDQPNELFVAVHLKASNAATAFEVVTKGTLNSSLVHPREVFRSAILQNAAAIIICHNHPSGNAEPSQEDLAITKQIVEAGKIIGIPVHDHIIFTESGFTSFAERGLL